MNETIKKINTVGKVSRIIIVITIIAVAVAAVAAIVSGCLLLTLPSDALSISAQGNAQISYNNELTSTVLDFETDLKNTSVDFHGIKFDLALNNENSEKGSIIADLSLDELNGKDIGVLFGVSSIFAGIISICICVILVFAKKLAVAFEKCNSPFEDNVLKCMKSFAISLIPWAVVSLFSSSLANALGGISFGSIGISGVLLVVVVILFVQIFTYGAQLQRDADETV